MEVEAKIKEYENFLESKLKLDLKDIEAVLLDKNNKLKEWKTVKSTVNTVQEFKDKNVDMHVNFNLGNNVYSFGHIEDYGNIYLDVGLGYLLEMDHEEIVKYSNIRIKLIEKEINHLRQLAVNVKVHVKMVLLAINELKCTLAN